MIVGYKASVRTEGAIGDFREIVGEVKIPLTDDVKLGVIRSLRNHFQLETKTLTILYRG